MTTELYREPAKIYQFPLRGPFAGRDSVDQSAAAASYSPPSFGSGWYHDEAIQEERARKDQHCPTESLR
jgi:hypothetical protein